MGPINFAGTVDRACVKTFRLVNGILDLETSFDMFDGSRDEGDSPASHYACNTVAEYGEFDCGLLGRDFELTDVAGGESEDGGVGKKVLMENTAVEGERAEHSEVLSFSFGFYTKMAKAYTESMNIHPTRGGVAPL